MLIKQKIITVLYKTRVTMGFVFGIAFLIFSMPVSQYFLISGIIIALVGETIRLISSGYIIKNDRLATYGPYGFVRHPLYLGSFIMGLGLCISVFSFEYIQLSLTFLLLFLILFFSVYIPVLKKEENVLIGAYGDLYKDYKKYVPMLIPRLKRYKGNNETEKFDKNVFLNNKEYRALIGLLGVMVIIIIKFKGTV